MSERRWNARVGALTLGAALATPAAAQLLADGRDPLTELSRMSRSLMHLLARIAQQSEEMKV